MADVTVWGRGFQGTSFQCAGGGPAQGERAGGRRLLVGNTVYTGHLTTGNDGLPLPNFREDKPQATSLLVQVEDIQQSLHTLAFVTGKNAANQA